MTDQQQRFVTQCCNEAGGGSSKAFLAIAGHDESAIRSALDAFRANANSSAIALSEPTWRLLYDTVNATVFALGPSELTTVTGYSLEEAANVQLRICAGVWGAYDGPNWTTNNNPSVT